MINKRESSIYEDENFAVTILLCGSKFIYYVVWNLPIQKRKDFLLSQNEGRLGNERIWTLADGMVLEGYQKGI